MVWDFEKVRNEGGSSHPPHQWETSCWGRSMAIITKAPVPDKPGPCSLTLDQRLAPKEAPQCKPGRSTGEAHSEPHETGLKSEQV